VNQKKQTEYNIVLVGSFVIVFMETYFAQNVADQNNYLCSIKKLNLFFF